MYIFELRLIFFQSLVSAMWGIPGHLIFASGKHSREGTSQKVFFCAFSLSSLLFTLWVFCWPLHCSFLNLHALFATLPSLPFTFEHDIPFFLQSAPPNPLWSPLSWSFPSHQWFYGNCCPDHCVGCSTAHNAPIWGPVHSTASSPHLLVGWDGKQNQTVSLPTPTPSPVFDPTSPLGRGLCHYYRGEWGRNVKLFGDTFQC